MGVEWGGQYNGKWADDPGREVSGGGGTSTSALACDGLLAELGANKVAAALAVSAGKNNDCFAFDPIPKQIGKAVENHPANFPIDLLAGQWHVFKPKKGLAKLGVEADAKTLTLSFVPVLRFGRILFGKATNVDSTEALPQARLNIARKALVIWVLLVVGRARIEQLLFCRGCRRLFGSE